MKTPVLDPASAEGAYPASSITRHASVRRRRCCGSIIRASGGETPKKAASKAAIPSMNPPHFTLVLPGSLDGSPQNDRQSQRSVGTSDMQERPSLRTSQNASMSGAPGNWQLIPTTAIRSSWYPPSPVCGSGAAIEGTSKDFAGTSDGSVASATSSSSASCTKVAKALLMAARSASLR